MAAITPLTSKEIRDLSDSQANAKAYEYRGYVCFFISDLFLPWLILVVISYALSDNEGITLPFHIGDSFALTIFDSNWLGPRETAYEIRLQIATLPTLISVARNNVDGFIRLCTLRYVYSELGFTLTWLNWY